MGKAMDKKSVIYGESKSQPLSGWNRWTDVQTLVASKVGPKETIAWSTAKDVVAKAAKNPKMADAYIKIGVIGSDLVLRVKEKKFLGDIEEDAILLRGYVAKAEAWEKAEAEKTPMERGREIVIDDLGKDRDRKSAWGNLRTLGASQAELDGLDSHDKVLALLDKLKIDRDRVMHLLTSSLLLSDRGHALAQLEIVDTPGKAMKLLEIIGVTRQQVDALSGGYSPELFAKDLQKLGVGPVTAARLSGMLVDAEAPSDKARRKLAAATDQKTAIKELAKLGIPVPTLQGWLSQSDLDTVAAAITARGVADDEAKRVAALIVP
jgi:hypothetical protein